MLACEELHSVKLSCCYPVAAMTALKSAVHYPAIFSTHKIAIIFHLGKQHFGAVFMLPEQLCPI